MTQVTYLQTTTVPKSYAQHGIKCSEDAMIVLREHMKHEETRVLARRVGVSISCLRAIMNGKTQWPRPRTFFGLIDVLDLEMILRPRKER
jgi:hypothetical protein